MSKGVFKRFAAKAQTKSLTPFLFLGSCCREDLLLSLSSLDTDEIFLEDPVSNPWQADLLIVAGPVNFKQIELLQRAYDEMMEPRYVMGIGACALTGGGFHSGIVSKNISEVIPVDVIVPGCPPQEEDLAEAMRRLKNKILQGSKV